MIFAHVEHEVTEKLKPEGLESGSSSPGSWKLFALAVITVTCAFLLQQVIAGSFYETNDDFAHALVLSGALAGTAPDDHLLTPHFLYSACLKQLYVIAPSIPWYFCSLLGLQWGGCMVLQLTFMRRLGIAFGIVAFLVYFVAVQAHLLACLQFTSTAIFAAACGAIYLLETCLVSGVSYLSVAVCSMLVLSAALLRSQSASMGIALAIPYLAVLRSDIARKVQSFAVLAALALSSFMLQVWNNDHYSRDGAWGEVFSLRGDLFKLVDGGGIGSAPDSPALKKAGWSENDGNLLKNFMYCDNQLFSAKRVQDAANAAPVLRSDASIEFYLSEVSNIFGDKTMWSCLLLTVAAAGFMTASTRARFLILTGVVGALLSYVLLTLKLPARVYFPSAGFLCAIAILNADKKNLGSFVNSMQLKVFRQRRSALVKGIASICCVVFCLVLIGKFQYETVVRNNRKLRQLEQETKLCIGKLRQRGGVYLTFGNAFPYEFLGPSTDLRTVFGGVNLVPTGGYNNSPWFNDRLEKLNLNRDILRALDKPGMYVISSEYFNSFYEKFSEEHLGTRVEMVPVEKNDRINVKVFSVRAVKEN